MASLGGSRPIFGQQKKSIFATKSRHETSGKLNLTPLSFPDFKTLFGNHGYLGTQLCFSPGMPMTTDQE